MKRRILRKGALVVVLITVVSIFSGCFWTADNAGEGGIALKIDASEIRGSGVGASQMVGSQESPSDSFLIAFVIAGDLLRGDPAEAVRAIDEVEAVILKAGINMYTQILVAKNSNAEIGNFDFSDVDVESTFPAMQSQAKVLSDTSGSYTFRDLKADREYLVAVYSVTWTWTDVNKEAIERMGFTTTTIESGETKTVSLNLDEKRDSFKRFLADSYNLTDPPGVRVTLAPVGKLSDLPETLYYDVVKLNNSKEKMNTADYYDNIGTYREWYIVDYPPKGPIFPPPLLLSDYTKKPSDGDLVGEKRKILLPNTRIESIAGVERGNSIRLIITDQEDSKSAPSETDRFVIGISDSFTFDNGQDIFVLMFEWGPGETNSGGDTIPGDNTPQ